AAPRARAPRRGRRSRRPPPRHGVAPPRHKPRAQASGLGVLPDERLHAPPGVGRGLRELRLLAVEEAVRRSRVDGRFVFDAGLAARGLELVDRRLWNTRVGATEEGEYAALVARDRVDRLGPIRPAAEAERPAVEADHTRVAEPARRLQIRERAAEAEADRED